MRPATIENDRNGYATQICARFGPRRTRHHYQRLPTEKGLKQVRTRILIADGVGLGKTLEAAMLTVELDIRGRGRRILVVTQKSMLT